MLLKKISKYLVYLGLVAVVYAWLVIFTSIHYNPWFVFTRDAFSDLGTPKANIPEIYNLGLITTGLLVMLYSIGLGYLAKNKIEDWGASFVFISGIFLALIGIFPGGTRPHTFVSSWFFIQMDLAILLWGIGHYLSGVRSYGVFLTLLSVFSGILGFSVDWPSAAVAEAFGIVVIDLWVFTSFLLVFKNRVRAISTE